MEVKSLPLIIRGNATASVNVYSIVFRSEVSIIGMYGYARSIGAVSISPDYQDAATLRTIQWFRSIVGSVGSYCAISSQNPILNGRFAKPLYYTFETGIKAKRFTVTINNSGAFFLNLTYVVF